MGKTCMHEHICEQLPKTKTAPKWPQSKCLKKELFKGKISNMKISEKHHSQKYRTICDQQCFYYRRKKLESAEETWTIISHRV